MQAETVADLLADPDYFFCEKLTCTLRKEVCIKRQKMSERKGWTSKNGQGHFLECVDCEQGKKIGENLSRLKESRTCEVCGCEFTPFRHGRGYSWKLCENCLYRKFMAGRKQKKENKMLTCKECGARFEPYKIGRYTAKSFCQDCYLKKKSNGQKRWRANMPLKINSDGRKDLFEYLQTRAKEHFREPEMELLAILDELKKVEGQNP